MTLETLNERVSKLEKVGDERDSIIGNISNRQTRMEEQIKQNAADLNDHGATIDHMENTISSILMPTQATHTEAIKSHGEKLSEHSQQLIKGSADIHELQAFNHQLSGAWGFVVKFGVVVAAITGSIGMGIQLYRMLH